MKRWMILLTLLAAASCFEADAQTMMNLSGVIPASMLLRPKGSSVAAPVITFSAPSASYVYPAASGTGLTTVTATVSSGSFLSGGGNFTSSNCAASNIAVASAGAVTVAGPSNLVNSQTCLITARYPGATDVTQTFTLTGTQQTIASITSPGGCSLGSGCSYNFSNSASPVTLDTVPTVTMSGGIGFSAGGGTITVPTSGAQCPVFGISGTSLQITENTPGTYACNYVIADANASNSPQTPGISAVGSSNPTTNVTAVSLTNENVVPHAPIGTIVGDLSATVTGGGPCTNCTWTFTTTGRPTGQPGPGCGPGGASHFQLVDAGGGVAHLEVLDPNLTPQIFGSPPATVNYVCVTATPSVGSLYTIAFAIIIRAPSFTSVMPLSVQYTSGNSEIIPLVATMCWTDCGQSLPAPTPVYTLGTDAACSPGLSISGQNLVIDASYAGSGVCHITASASGVICPTLGYLTPTPVNCSVPIYLTEGSYVGPGDALYPNGATGLSSWTVFNLPYAFSSACAASGCPIWKIIRERDQRVFTINTLLNGDMDITTLANDCDTSMCYIDTEYDQSGNSPANDILAWADTFGYGCPVSPWTGSVVPTGCPLQPQRPIIYFNALNGVFPGLTNSNGADRFVRNSTTYNGSGSVGTMGTVALYTSGGYVLNFNTTSTASTDSTYLGVSAPNAYLYVGNNLGVTGIYINNPMTANVFHDLQAIVDGSVTNGSLLNVDGVTVTGTFTTSPLPSLVKPFAQGGGYGGGSLTGYLEGAWVSPMIASTLQLQALACFDYQHFGAGPPC
jgi:hypothetical protein